jgi:hypothetical protein
VLKRETLNRASLVFLAFFIAYIGVAICGDALQINVCEKDYYTGHKHCPSYDVLRGVLFLIGSLADRYAGLIAALAGIAVAAFTGTLWWSTKRLWEASEAQLAAAKTEFEATERRAKNALDQAKETAEADLRAYVGLIDIRLHSPKLGDDKYEIPSPLPPGYIFEDYIIYEVKNFGRTPAFNLSVEINWFPVPFANRLPDGFKFEDFSTFSDRLTFDRSSNIVDPGSIHTGTVSVNALSIFRDAIAKHTSLYYYGHIDFMDVYKREWRREFCYYFQPWQTKEHQLVAYKEHNKENIKGG